MIENAKTYYGVLGVLRMAPQEEIRDAYYRLAVLHHPDRGGDVNIMVRLTKAWNALKTPEKRKEYEKFLVMTSTYCKKCSSRGGVPMHKGFQKTLRRCPDCNGEGVSAVTVELS